MKVYIQDLDKMTDSREMLEARPHSFISIFVYLLIAILIAALVWSYFGEMDDYVKANGSVRPNEKISTIKNSVAGKVEQVHYEDGQKVKKGDVLFSIEHATLDVEKLAVSSQIEKISIDLANLHKFKQSIDEGKNNFDKNAASEADYYNRYAKYDNDVKVNLQQANNANLDLQHMIKEAKLVVKSNASRIQQAKDALSQLMLLNQSIAEDTNLFDPSQVEYANKFIDYKFNLTRLTETLVQKKSAYKMAQTLFLVGGISLQEQKDAKDVVDRAELELNKYKNEYLMNLNATMLKYSIEVEQLGIDGERSQQTIVTSSGKTDKKELITNRYKFELLNQINDSITRQQQNLEKLEKDLKSINVSLADSTVTAPIDGIVNVNAEVTKGDLLQSGSQVATIVPQNNTQFKIQLYVSNKDIASVKEGQAIKYHFQALPYKEYGNLEGTVSRIGTDAKVDPESGSSYYIVEATLDNKPMYSYKGIKSEIKVGMVCEAQVVNSSKKVLYWFLEKINLKD